MGAIAAVLCPVNSATALVLNIAADSSTAGASAGAANLPAEILVSDGHPRKSVTPLRDE
ncbi:hypothetical protein [Nocardia salmonicida]|uniref:hypothetical protein n=1 Tax=Nocardia salmonicida TaxID=53431 RepID=UPI000B0B912F|nr:hypothetical protein [Nocardia salmonicida]